MWLFDHHDTQLAHVIHSASVCVCLLYLSITCSFIFIARENCVYRRRPWWLRWRRWRRQLMLVNVQCLKNAYNGRKSAWNAFHTWRCVMHKSQFAKRDAKHNIYIYIARETWNRHAHVMCIYKLELHSSFLFLTLEVNFFLTVYYLAKNGSFQQSIFFFSFLSLQREIYGHKYVQLILFTCPF